MDKNMQDKVIDIHNIDFWYEDVAAEGMEPENRALKNVSLSVKRGEFLAILGHNGSGKSTLAKHLNAILVPQSGKVLVEGIDTSDEKRLFDIRQRVGMVFQNPDNQLVATLVEEDVAFAPENLGVPCEEIQKRVDYALEAVNMTEFRNHAPHMLSGGQKQRIAIAGVLAMKPGVLVMDEPTAMLDPVGRKEIMQTVKSLNKDEHMTVVMITHFMEEAAEADRVVVMDHGEIIVEGTPKEIFSQVEVIKKLGLDVPQATELCFELNKSGFDFDLEILTAKECADAIVDAYNKFKGVSAHD